MSLVIKMQDKDAGTIEISAKNQSAVELTALLKSLTADAKTGEEKWAKPDADTPSCKRKLSEH